MKLLRFGPAGSEKPGLLDAAGSLRDLSGVVSDITPDSLSPVLLARLAALDPAGLPLVEGAVRLGPPVGGVGKIVCIGLNYRDHAKEAGMPVPGEPLLFMKSPTAIIGPDDPVVLPAGAQKGDWEVELAIVIGRKARLVSRGQAAEYIAGYSIMNDVSERAFQLEHGGQWVKGKSFDSFAPFGPWLVTGDEIGDPQSLDLWLDVNEIRRQTGNTATMIFDVFEIVSYVSRFMTLLPGDVISTGTPPGVGMGHKPPIFLKAGDVMRLGITGLGEQRQKVEMV
jgi:2-keto-4-pentenoate hydratase/2-oxohepta-3-ene-1,7-dioic acid hydratase in catechol pathway